MPDARIVPSGGGEQLSARGSALLFKALAATTGGAFSLHERRVPAGGRRPPAHRHPEVSPTTSSDAGERWGALRAAGAHPGHTAISEGAND
jgi:hypothetical protein